MLQGILMVIGFTISYFLVYLAYGKEGMELRQELGKKHMTIFQTAVVVMAAIFYGLLIGLWSMEATHDWYEYAYLVGAPVAYGLFVLYGRNWTKRNIKRVNEEKERAIREEKERKAWEARQRVLQTAPTTEDVARFHQFLDSGRACKTFVELLEHWDSLGFVGNAYNAMIRTDIQAKADFERKYGSTYSRVPNLLAILKKTYHVSDEELQNISDQTF